MQDTKKTRNKDKMETNMSLLPPYPEISLAKLNMTVSLFGIMRMVEI